MSAMTDPDAPALESVVKVFRSFAERIDFWVATEAAAIRLEDGESDDALCEAHYAEFIWPGHNDGRRYR